MWGKARVVAMLTGTMIDIWWSEQKREKSKMESERVTENEVGEMKEKEKAIGMVRVKMKAKETVKVKENGKVKGIWKGRVEWRWDSLRRKS